MKFIKPNSVSGEILNLVDEANKKMVLVSPYCKFDKWYRLVNKIKELKSRNIDVEFYIRDGETETKEQIKAIGFEARCIPNLHCKLYFNENVAIITSMNLLLSSEINSLEIGYKTETREEYNEVLEFYKTYLNKSTNNAAIDYISVEENSVEENFDWISALNTNLSNKVGNIRIFINDDNSINIKTNNNNYTVFIANEKKSNILRISGILSGKEFDYTESIKKKIALKNLEIELISGSKKYYDSIIGAFVETLKSYDIRDIRPSESKIIVQPIVDFISKVEEIKNYCYENRKNM